MEEAEDKRIRVDIKIKFDDIYISVKKLTRATALDIALSIQREYPNNEFIKENMPSCLKGFGHVSSSHGENELSFSSYIPVVKLDEKQICPRRMNTLGIHDKSQNIDNWEMRGDDKCCSYCGSIHPERVIELIKEHGFSVIGKTDKDYKWYVNQPGVINAMHGGIKYYRQHDDAKFIKDYNELLKIHKDK